MWRGSLLLFVSSTKQNGSAGAWQLQRRPSPAPGTVLPPTAGLPLGTRLPPGAHPILYHAQLDVPPKGLPEGVVILRYNASVHAVQFSTCCSPCGARRAGTCQPAGQRVNKDDRLSASWPPGGASSRRHRGQHLSSARLHRLAPAAGPPSLSPAWPHKLTFLSSRPAISAIMSMDRLTSWRRMRRTTRFSCRNGGGQCVCVCVSQAGASGALVRAAEQVAAPGGLPGCCVERPADRRPPLVSTAAEARACLGLPNFP